MKVLLDENLDHRLKIQIPNSFTVFEMGWSSPKNGELLKQLAAEKFSFFVTADLNLPYQQNERKIIAASLTVIVLQGKNEIREHVKHIDQINGLITSVDTPKGFVVLKYKK
ncbi:MAG TPA: hypothetical protein VL728_14105 [Cyclobacteriaceae bacterium]|jgi:hypothetical protein|nr:hypothetical protein [Cyclobacteriaceae bacterium]